MLRRQAYNNIDMQFLVNVNILDALKFSGLSLIQS